MSGELKKKETLEMDLPELDELDMDFITEWEDLKRQLRDLREEQNRPMLVPTLLNNQ